jgi:hypothetical protein
MLVVDDNVEMLEHVFGMLELGGGSENLELVIVAQDPSLEEALLRRVRRWRFGNRFASTKTIVPTLPVTFGAAVNHAVAAIDSSCVAVMSDEVLPPSSNWVKDASQALATGKSEIILPQVMTFDHLPSDFEHLFDLDWSEFEFDHSNIERDLPGSFAPFRALPSGVVFTTQKLLASQPFDECYSFKDVTFLDFLIKAGGKEMGNIARVDSQFTHLKLKEHTWSDARVRLVNLYAFLDACHQRLAATESSGTEARAVGWDSSEQLVPLRGSALAKKGPRSLINKELRG